MGKFGSKWNLAAQRRRAAMIAAGDVAEPRFSLFLPVASGRKQPAEEPFPRCNIKRRINSRFKIFPATHGETLMALGDQFWQFLGIPRHDCVAEIQN
jgi:hypothetical protein